MQENMLNEIRHFDWSIELKKKRLEEVRENTTKMNKQLKQDRVQTSVRKGFEDKLLDALELEKSLVYDIGQLYSMKSKVYDAVRDIKNIKVRNVMIRYYLSDDAPTVKEIADELCYTIDHVKRLKRQGVKIVLEKINGKN